MNYWLTTHWPPMPAEVSASNLTGIFLRDGCEHVGFDIQPGDIVAIYQTGSGKDELHERTDGTSVVVKRTGGLQAVVCYGEVISELYRRKGSRPQKYVGGREIWWRWKADVRILSRSGVVKRQDLVRILGYKPGYGMRGFGDYSSGLKKLSPERFNQIQAMFHGSSPIKLPSSNSHCVVNSGGRGAEGPIHKALKEYIGAAPELAIGESGLRTVSVEYRFPTGDCADVVLVDAHNRIVAVEVEPAVRDGELAGPLQAMKYRAMIECLAGREPGDARGILVAHKMSSRTRRTCQKYGIEVREVAREDVERWVRGRHMTNGALEDAVKNGFLVPVQPCAPTTSDRELAEAESRAMYRQGLSGYTCEENAKAFVQAVNAQEGRCGWRVAYGLAFLGSKSRFPATHAWVTDGSTHIDMTWARWSQNLEDNRYYEVKRPLPDDRKLDAVADLARKWGIQILEDQPFDSDGDDSVE